MLKYILLGFLNYQPMSGYDLKSLMDESTSHFWHAYHSQIYTTLRKLEEDGLLVSEEIEAEDAKLNRRVYSITAAGQAELRDWLAQTMSEPTPVKEDLLVRLFFSGSRDRESTLNELRLQRQFHQQKLALYNSLSPHHLVADMDATPELLREARFWATTLEFGKRYEHMYLAWLEDTIRTIEAF